MKRRTAIVLSGLASFTLSGAAQEVPHGVGPHAVLITEVAVVEVFKGINIEVKNTAEPKLQVITFPSFEACQASRNVALLPTAISMPLGTGNLAQAHIGRTVTECFQQ